MAADTLLTGGVREGDILAGKYRIDRLIGAGGMGVVVVVGNNNKCIETTCVDSGCGTNTIVTWLDVAGGASHAVTSGYGVWRGWLVKRGSHYELWTNGSDSYGNDAVNGCKTN